MSQKETSSVSGDSTSSNSLWVFSIADKQWLAVIGCNSLLPSCSLYRSLISSSSPLPSPRFAHQLVLEPTNQIHYMFGGNPGKGQNVQARLDDLWDMKV